MKNSNPSARNHQSFRIRLKKSLIKIITDIKSSQTELNATQQRCFDVLFAIFLAVRLISWQQKKFDTNLKIWQHLFLCYFHVNVFKIIFQCLWNSESWRKTYVVCLKVLHTNSCAKNSVFYFRYNKSFKIAQNIDFVFFFFFIVTLTCFDFFSYCLTTLKHVIGQANFKLLESFDLAKKAPRAYFSHLSFWLILNSFLAPKCLPGRFLFLTFIHIRRFSNLLFDKMCFF